MIKEVRPFMIYKAFLFKYNIMSVKNVKCVYFIRYKGLLPIKIGYSSDINKRIMSYKTTSPYDVEVLGIIESETAIKLEKYLHHKYINKKIKGEWFNITDKDVEQELLLNNIDVKLYEKESFLGFNISKKDNLLSATDFTDIMNKKRFLKDKTLFNLKLWLNSKGTIDVIKDLNLKYENIIEDKLSNHVWMHPMLLIHLALKIDISLKIEVYSFIYEYGKSDIMKIIKNPNVINNSK